MSMPRRTVLVSDASRIDFNLFDSFGFICFIFLPPRPYSGEGWGEGLRRYSMFNNKETIKRCKELRKKSTPQEIIFWSRVRAKRFHNLKFRRQHQIGKYIVDFVCLNKKIIIELDGFQHKEENQERYDKTRTEFLEKENFIIIRFWNNEINDNLDGVFIKIEEFL